MFLVGISSLVGLEIYGKVLGMLVIAVLRSNILRVCGDRRGIDNAI